jgi:hypothetical protein
VAEITVKRLLCCGFRRTDKAMGQVYQRWWRIYREFFFPGSIITCFTFQIHIFVSGAAIFVHSVGSQLLFLSGSHFMMKYSLLSVFMAEVRHS